MKKQFTEGKWTFGKYSGGDFGVYSEMGNGNDIALVRSRKSETEAKANAKLIAAAPELLDALENVSDYFDILDKNSYPPELFETVKNAIKKATD